MAALCVGLLDKQKLVNKILRLRFALAEGQQDLLLSNLNPVIFPFSGSRSPSLTPP